MERTFNMRLTTSATAPVFMTAFILILLFSSIISFPTHKSTSMRTASPKRGGVVSTGPGLQFLSGATKGFSENRYSNAKDVQNFPADYVVEVFGAPKVLLRI